MTLNTETNTFVFTPAPGFVGTTTVKFQVIDPQTQQLTEVTYTITVIDPAGIVYDAVSRLPVAGTRVELLDANGQLVRDECLSPSTPNGPVTGEDGRYTLLLSTAAHCVTVGPALFSLRVTPPPGYKPGFSNAIVPEPTPYSPRLGGGIEYIQSQDAPPLLGQTTTYYKDFLFVVSSDARTASNGVGQNHIPLDPVPNAAHGFMAMSKTGSASAVELGDSLLYTLTLNYANSASNPMVQTGVVIHDTLPLGFKYIPGSAVMTHGSERVSDDQTLGLQGVGPELNFRVGTLTSASGVPDRVVVSYRVRVGVGAQSGTGVNRASAVSANGLASNEARFKVNINNGVFAQEACLIGKVYLDCNANGVQDGEDEWGVPGVRMYMEDGSFVVSDGHGKYSFCGISPQTHVIKVDAITLPQGSEMAITSNRNAADPHSAFIDMKIGELHRVDFVEGSCSPDVRKQVGARRTLAKVFEDTLLLSNDAVGAKPLTWLDPASALLTAPKGNTGAMATMPLIPPQGAVPGYNSNAGRELEGSQYEFSGKRAKPILCEAGKLCGR